MKSKFSSKKLNNWIFSTIGIFIFIALSQVKCTDSNATNTTLNPPTTTTIVKKWDTCNIGLGSKREQDLLKNLTTIMGKNYAYSDDEHQYYFTVCSKSEKADDVDQGFVQINKATKRKFVLGRLDDVDLEGILEGKYKFIRLTYKNGDNYAGSCQKTSRNAIIYIFCDEKDEFKMIEENNGRDNDQCGYVFQLDSPSMCQYLQTPCSQSGTTTTSTSASSITTPATGTSNGTTVTTASSSSSKSPSTSSKMGFFAILLIIVFSLISVYLVVGTLFKRYVRQARGWEQIPNWRMWQIIGNRSADCCNYICRCGKARTEPNAYENIIDHASDDENLLNM